MVQDPDKIKQHIDNERANLSRNLDEIEYRFRNATDLKAQFARNTGWFLAAAAASGFLLSRALDKSSTAAGRRSPSFKEPDTTKAAHLPSFVSKHLDQVSETVDGIVAGLVGVFSEKLRSAVAEAVPGFREQVTKNETAGPGQ